MSELKSSSDALLKEAKCCDGTCKIGTVSDDKLKQMDLSNSMLYATIEELIRKVNILIEYHNSKIELDESYLEAPNA